MADIHLSPRETQVLQGIADGNNREYLASQLGITRMTLYYYTNSIRRKLGANSTEEAVATAVALGLIHVDLNRVFIVIEIERSLISSG